MIWIDVTAVVDVILHVLIGLLKYLSDTAVIISDGEVRFKIAVQQVLNVGYREIILKTSADHHVVVVIAY